MATCVYLGDLSVSDIESEHGFSFTDEERDLLASNHHEKADFSDGLSGWHLFDVPRFLVVTDDAVGRKCLDVFIAHNHDYRHRFPAGYAPEGHRD